MKENIRTQLDRLYRVKDYLSVQEQAPQERLMDVIRIINFFENWANTFIPIKRKPKGF